MAIFKKKASGQPGPDEAKDLASEDLTHLSDGSSASPLNNEVQAPLFPGDESKRGGEGKAGSERPHRLTLDPSERYELLDSQSFQKTSMKLDAELGRGGFGRVLIAYDTNVGRRIAIKEILPKHKPEISNRFLFEARLTGQLDHPSIVPVYEIGRHEGGTLYYTMKLVRGRTLSQAINQCRNLSDRLKLLSHFVDVCHAIAYAHSRSIVHRDIKTMNIMLGEFGETMVLDWGIAKFIGAEDTFEKEASLRAIQEEIGDSVKTMDGTVVGTLKYMSPEQTSGQVSEIDQRSDVWSLGAVLYEILTGIPPYHGLSGLKEILRAQKKAVRPISETHPLVPFELAAICQKALSLKKEDRYAGAKELAEEIEAYRSGLKVSAYEYSSWKLIKRFVSKNKLLSVVAMVSFILLIAATVMIFNAYQNAEIARKMERTQRIQAQQNEQKANFNLSVAYYEKSIRDMDEKNYLSALVNSASALYQNPNNPFGPKRAREPEIESQKTATPYLLLQRSVWYHAFVNNNISHEATLSGHSDTVYQAVFSTDSKFIASAGRDKTVRLWDVKTATQKGVLANHSDYVLGVAFSPDGKTLVSGGRDGTLRIYEVGDSLREKEVHTDVGFIYKLDFSADGKYLAAGSKDRTVKIWDLSDLRKAPYKINCESPVISIDFSPDGRLLAASENDGRIRIYNLSKRKIAVTLTGHQGAVNSVRFSPDGDLLASAGSDNTVRLWNVALQKEEDILKGHEDLVFSVGFSPDGKTLASAGRDKAIRLWNVTDHECVTTLKRQEADTVNSVEFSRDGKYLVSSDYGGKIDLWHIRTQKLQSTFYGIDDTVTSGKISADGKHLAATTIRKAIQWKTSDQLVESVINEKKNDIVWSADLSSDGMMLITAGSDKIIRIYRYPFIKPESELKGHTGWILSVAYSESADLIASASKDGSVRLWDPKLKEMVARFSEHGKDSKNVDVMSIAFSPDGQLLASGGKDNGIAIYDVPSKKLIRKMPCHENWVTNLAFSSDGKLLLSSCRDGLMKMWDTDTGKLHRTFTGHSKWVNDAVFSPDMKMIISGSDDQTLRVWNTETGEEILRLTFPNEITYAAFTPDGKNIVFNDGSRIKTYPVMFSEFKKNPSILLKEARNISGM